MVDRERCYAGDCVCQWFQAGELRWEGFGRSGCHREAAGGPGRVVAFLFRWRIKVHSLLKHLVSPIRPLFLPV